MNKLKILWFPAILIAGLLIAGLFWYFQVPFFGALGQILFGILVSLFLVPIVWIVAMGFYSKYTTRTKSAPPPAGGGHGHKEPGKAYRAFVFLSGLIVAFVPITLVIIVGWWFYGVVTAPTTNTQVAYPEKWCQTPCRMRVGWSKVFRSEKPVWVKFPDKEWLWIPGQGDDEIPYEKFNIGLAEFKSADDNHPNVKVYIYAAN